MPATHTPHDNDVSLPRSHHLAFTGPGGVWTEEELLHHAGLLAMSFVSQNSCNCLAPKLVVLDKEWPQRQAFVDAVHAILRLFPALPPHYPGTTERYEGFRAAYSTRQVSKPSSQPPT